MRKSRWIVPWAKSLVKPVIYHCVSRICQRQLHTDEERKEKFQLFRCMYEEFSGCRVLSYGIMDYQIHILPEVDPIPKGGLSDKKLLKHLRCSYNNDVVRFADEDLTKAREQNNTNRMHDLSQFMKSMMGRFSKWYSRYHQHKGVLLEERFKCVIVEDGYAARRMAAYIDLNSVQAGIVKDPASYRRSNYGEAMGRKHKACAGLARADMAHKGWHGSSKQWSEGIARDFICHPSRLDNKPNLLADMAEVARLRGLELSGLEASVARWEMVLEEISNQSK